MKSLDDRCTELCEEMRIRNEQRTIHERMKRAEQQEKIAFFISMLAGLMGLSILAKLML